MNNSRMVCVSSSLFYICANLQQAFPVRQYKEIQSHSFHQYSVLALIRCSSLQYLSFYEIKKVFCLLPLHLLENQVNYFNFISGINRHSVRHLVISMIVLNSKLGSYPLDSVYPEANFTWHYFHPSYSPVQPIKDELIKLSAILVLKICETCSFTGESACLFAHICKI